MSSDGMAAQFTSTKGRPLRADSRWMARATNSFPVPDSPYMRTGAADGAALVIRSNTLFMTVDLPSMPWKPSSFDNCFLS